MYGGVHWTVQQQCTVSSYIEDYPGECSFGEGTFIFISTIASVILHQIGTVGSHGGRERYFTLGCNIVRSEPH